VASGVEKGSFQGHNDYVYSVAVARDGTMAASAGWDDRVRLWDPSTRVETRSLEHPSNVYAVAFAPDGKTVASGGFNEVVRVWDVATGKLISALSGHTMPVNDLAFAPDGKTLASGSEDNTVRLWDLGGAR
jgi:WD40 repeat protein